jgi:hypothetical protein
MGLEDSLQGAVKFAQKVAVDGMSWAFFIGALALASDFAIGAAVRRLKEDTNADAESVRRPYIITLCAYEVALIWAIVTVLVLVMYLASITLLILIPRSHELVSYVIETYLAPHNLIQCVSAKHMRFHALVAGSILAFSGIITALYISDRDFAGSTNNNTTAEIKSTIRSKTARLLFVIPLIMTIATATYAFIVVIMGIGGEKMP